MPSTSIKDKMTVPAVVLAVILAVGTPALGALAETGSVSGVVRDSTGEAIGQARVLLLSGGETVVSGTRTDKEGRFAFQGVAAGRYMLIASCPGFNDFRRAVAVLAEQSVEVDVTLELAPVKEEVSVTATAGVARDTRNLTQPVNIIDSNEIIERAKAVVAQVAAEEPGLQLLRTSPSLAGVYIRGLTGNKVNTFVDGVRYSTAAVRGGITTFMDLIDPSHLLGIEILRGPNSAQYGSDALGGSLQFLTRVPALTSGGRRFSGAYGAQANSGDQSYGGNFSAEYSTESFGLLVSSAARRINLIRPGEGIDSHAAVTRFFGLTSNRLMPARLPDTSFTQYGGMLKLNWALSPSAQILVAYSRTQQDGGKRYDQLLGGDGNLVADLRNLMGDLFYIKYNRAEVGPFDQVTATYSYNAQREERVNQGGNGNPDASINHEFERTTAHGFQIRGLATPGRRHELLFGFDIYPERIKAPSYGVNPVTDVTSVRRGRVPDGATYLSTGTYLQDSVAIIADKLHFVGDLRFSTARYNSRAADSPLVDGRPLWPDDRMTTSSLTFRAGLVASPWPGFQVRANVSRGFRAPHITDLGTVGLTGSGFQVAADMVQGLGAEVGDSAGNGAVSTGRPVEKIRPETSLAWETGLSYRGSFLETEATFFVNTIRDNIAYQALILPPGAVGLALGDQTISEQGPTGVVYVPASSSPVLVRTNFGDARILGFEHWARWRVTRRWTVESALTLLRAEDIATGLAPNIEGGTPGPDFYMRLRYSHPNDRFWAESYVHWVGKQSRLSSLDFEDRRTGATRTRSGIRNFFNNGARARGWVGEGTDGVFGTSDDVLLATGETLAQVQDRVLGVGVNSLPLFTAVPGYLTLNVRACFKLWGRHAVIVELENLTDENYRGIAWGLDAPGRGISISYQTAF
jgi:outer membrane receptor protein involved in Fe transport